MLAWLAGYVAGHLHHAHAPFLFLARSELPRGVRPARPVLAPAWCETFDEVEAVRAVEAAIATGGDPASVLLEAALRRGAEEERLSARWALGHLFGRHDAGGLSPTPVPYVELVRGQWLRAADGGREILGLGERATGDTTQRLWRWSGADGVHLVTTERRRNGWLLAGVEPAVKEHLHRQIGFELSCTDLA